MWIISQITEYNERGKKWMPNCLHQILYNDNLRNVGEEREERVKSEKKVDTARAVPESRKFGRPAGRSGGRTVFYQNNQCYVNVVKYYHGLRSALQRDVPALLQKIQDKWKVNGIKPTWD